jgi:calcium permeable stress-gated cation channel
MYIITKETTYYINLRYAFCLTPRNSMRIPSRTVLFTSVPPDWQNEEWLRAEFDQIQRVWTATDCKELEKLVHERDTIALKLEAAVVKLLSTAVANSIKEDAHRPYRVADVTSRYVGSHERPMMRFIPLIGLGKDTIKSSLYKLQELIPQTKQQQQNHLHGRTKTLPAVFIQFETQRAAQAAFQTSHQNQPGSIEPRGIDTLPDEIIWKYPGIARWSRIARTFISHTIIVLLILFWSIPVGLVGALANIDSLVGDLPFLRFINKIPVATLGAITGLLPALLISALLALVPIICRCMLRICSKVGATKANTVSPGHPIWSSHVRAGRITHSELVLRFPSCASISDYAFQVVQVFLIATFSSGASAVASKFPFY